MLRSTRYAHFEGHTDVCFSDDGRFILTCGSDGDVRKFEGLDDDDSKSYQVSDCAHAIECTRSRMLVGTSTNLVQAFTISEGHPDGIITRFTAPVTHITANKSGNIIAAASSDMTIKVHDSTAFKDKLFTGHTAPVLSIALDPKGEYLASSSCDGSVKIWNIEHGMEVKSINILPKCNSFNLSSTLCRLDWSKDGDLIFIPLQNEVKVYNRSNWKENGSFVADLIKKEDTTVSVVALSPNGKLLASGTRQGHIVIWQVATKRVVAEICHPNKLPICGLKWKPTGDDELAFVDADGHLGTVVDIDIQLDSTENAEAVPSPSSRPCTPPASNFPPDDIDFPPDFGDDDDNEISISQIKSNHGFANDEEGTFIGTQPNPEDDKECKREDDFESKVSLPPAPVFKLPDVQKPFQPGMSPEHLEARYMVWNNVGIVRQYTGEENSIEVEFHDTSVHHSLHQNNTFNHSMAALSTQVLVLACEAMDDQPSKLQVQHLGSWDSSKEWFIDMPEGEEILAICTGNNWIAVATDRRNLRIFSTGGIQRDLLSLSGPAVCLSGFQDSIFILYHSGMGVSGDQNISCKVFNVNGGRHPMPVSTEVDLSPRSFISWAGFTDEGSPATLDSAGIIRIIHPKYSYSWTPILNSRAHTKGKSDNYFILGINETQNNIRCIMCKGSRFPPILPRPHVSILDIKIPLCEPHTEKTELEENILRLTQLISTLTRLSENDFDVDESKKENEKFLKEKFIKLFALSCQSDRELRGYDVCQLMPSSHLVETAIKYAGKIRKITLAERLGEVVSTKVEEEQEKAHLLHRQSYQQEIGYLGVASKPPRVNDSESDDETICGTSSNEISTNTQIRPSRNPLLEARNKKISIPDISISQSIDPDRNPFKKANEQNKGLKRGIDMIEDTSKKNTSSSEASNGLTLKSGFGIKGQLKQPHIKSKLSNTSSSTQNKENKANNTIISSFKPNKKSALNLWFEDNKEIVKTRFPETLDEKLFSKAALVFKDVDDQIKQKYKSLASSQLLHDTTKDDTIDNDKKRKLDESSQPEDSQEEKNPFKKKTTESSRSKLSAFACKKDD